MLFRQMDNKLTIAAAGSGKTTKLINDSLKIEDTPVLITTYTEANALEIHNKFIKEIGCIPSNITIQTWFSLLIQHGVKPFQSYLFEEKVMGMKFMSHQSAEKFRTNSGRPSYWAEKDFHEHYFTKSMRIYSDKLSKLVYRLNTKSNGKVIDRLTNVYPIIFVDESQDLAGYDLEIIQLLSLSAEKLHLVCDPRQVTYLTHNSRKNSKYKNGLISNFIEEKCKKSKFTIDSDTLSHSYRCNQLICDFSNKLYPDLQQCNSKQNKSTNHDGVFLVNKPDVARYLNTYSPVQLRWNRRNDKINPEYPVYNFGQSKGLTFDRVLIYPTKSMVDWLQNNSANLTNEARAKFYVALTRAKYSVGIVCDTNKKFEMNGFEIFE